MPNTNSNPCAAVDIYDSLRFCGGEPVLPGLRKAAYAVSRNQVSSFATLPEIAASLPMNKAAVLEGEFEFYADKTAIRIDLLDTASGIESASQGEKPSKTVLNALTIKYAGNDEAAAGFCRMVNNDDMIFFVQMRNGKWRVVGNEAFGTNVNPTLSSGQNVTDASGTTLEITGTDVAPAPFYEGLLHTVDGWLNCKTNEITSEKPVSAGGE